MSVGPVCPRCSAPLHAPGVWSSDWRCDAHGAVSPLQPARPADAAHLGEAARRAGVPVWAPWPLPPGWLVTGVRLAGDDRGPAPAVAMAASGPGLMGGPVDLVIVAEEPGVGLGARYAGIDGPDAGGDMVRQPADVTVAAADHDTPLWSVPGVRDRTAYVGEAAGRWLWLVVWPVSEWMVVHDALRLIDLRERDPGLDVPAGALTPRLAD